MDSSPVENGNMIMIKEYTPRLNSLAKVFVSADALEDPSLDMEYEGEFYVYRVKGEKIDPNPVSSYVRTESVNISRTGLRYEPHSIRLGLFLMLIAVMLVSSLTVAEFVARRTLR